MANGRPLSKPQVSHYLPPFLLITLLSVFVMFGCAGSSRNLAPQIPMDPDTAAWRSVRNPRDVEAYIARFPAGQYNPIARDVLADERIIREIRANGPGSRFVSPELSEQMTEVEIGLRRLADLTGAWTRVRIIKNEHGKPMTEALAGQLNLTMKEELGRREGFLNGNFFGGNRFEVLGTSSEELVLGDGSVIVFATPIGFVLSTYFLDPLRFVVIRGVGLVYLGGKGNVLNSRGVEQVLGNP